MVVSKRSKSRAKRVDSKGPWRKPIRPIDRQKMRPWLVNLLDHGEVPGLYWKDRCQQIFEVTWRHAARQGWTLEKDAEVFERWALHTGKFFEGDEPDPKRWKANFRCALHSLPDVHEIKEEATRKGQNARRIYQFLDGDVKGKKKGRGRRPSKRRPYDETDSEEEEDFDISEEEEMDEVDMSEPPTPPPRAQRPTRFPRHTKSNAPHIAAPTPAPLPSLPTSTPQATQTPENEERMEFVESPVLPHFDKLFSADQVHKKSPQPSQYAHTTVGVVTIMEARTVPKMTQPLNLDAYQVKVERMTSVEPSSPCSDRGSLTSSPSYLCTEGSNSPHWGSEGEDSGVNMSDEEVVDLLTELECGPTAGQYHPRLWNDEIIVDGQVDPEFMQNTDGDLTVHVVPEQTITDFNLTGIQDV